MHHCVFVSLELVLYIYIGFRTTFMEPPYCATTEPQNSQTYTEHLPHFIFLQVIA